MFDDIFDFDDEEELSEEGAEHTLNPQTALKLISKLYQLPNAGGEYQLKSILHLLEKLLDLMGEVPRKDEQLQNIYSQLYRLSAKTVEQSRLPALSGKTVVGVGGMFSAGKSSFLNSLTGIELLPSDQQKCTAVATYMVAGTQQAVTAYTSADLAIPLSSEELQAISHQFYDSYGMGFSNIIRKMIMTLPQFEWPEIVLLDTPGYNSDYSEDYDSDDLMNDKKVAREHLSNCDYLIWLVDIENGVIPPGDIDFIKKLNLVNKVLFVLNKADKKTDDELKEVLNSCKKNLKKAQIFHSDITAFSSRTGEESLGQSFLKEYLLMASQFSSIGSNANVSAELTRLTNEWQGNMELKLKVFEGEIRGLQAGILASRDPRHISSLLHSYRFALQQSTGIFRQTERLKKLCQNLQSLFSDFEGRKV